MKCTLLLSFLVFIFFKTSFSQSSFFLTELFSGKNITNQTILNDVEVMNVDTELIYQAKIQNISNEVRHVKVRRYLLNVDTFTRIKFCWATCVGYFTDTAESYVTINPGESDEQFMSHFYPKYLSGFASIAYKFYDYFNPIDSVGLTLEYNILFTKVDKLQSSGSKAISVKGKKLELEYYERKNALLTLFNSEGKPVIQKSISGIGMVEIDLSNFKSGFYCYTIYCESGLSERGKLVLVK